MIKRMPMLILQENSTIGQKISLTEKIVAVLPKVGIEMEVKARFV